jgi:hypothetical protein
MNIGFYLYILRIAHSLPHFLSGVHYTLIWSLWNLSQSSTKHFLPSFHYLFCVQILSCIISLLRCRVLLTKWGFTISIKMRCRCITICTGCKPRENVIYATELEPQFQVPRQNPAQNKPKGTKLSFPKQGKLCYAIPYTKPILSHPSHS